MSTTDYSPFELRDMDEETARNTLTVAEFERWESVQDLSERADERAAEFEDGDATVMGVVVEADMSELGAELELYGNDLLVYLDPDDKRVREVARTLEDEFGGLSPDDAEELDAADEDRLVELLTEFVRLSIMEWNGEDFGDLPEASQKRIAANAADQWGTVGLLVGMLKIAEACDEAQDEWLGAVDQFRGAQGRGTDRTPRQDRV